MKIPYKLRSIKFWLAVAVLLAGTLFYTLGIGEATYRDWINFMQWIIGLFMIANVASKKFSKEKGREK